MKQRFKPLFLAAAILLLGSCAKDDMGTGSGGDTDVASGPILVNASTAALNGEIVLCLKESAAESVAATRAAGGPATRSGIDQLDRILNEAGTVRFERLFPECGRFEERTRREGLHRWFYAQYDPTISASTMAEMLSACTDIEIIEFSLPAVAADYRRTTSPDETEPTRAIADEVRNVAFPFNESERAQELQWHYNNRGNVFTEQTRMGADANVYAAWQLSTGNPDVIVAVVDQGVKYDHEDLAANMWINQAELNGTAGADDDGNGYVDDIYGYNFTNNTGSLSFSAEESHGTHVAGTIAAVNNNGVGVCGIAGGSGKGDGVKIMSCEILNESESGSSGAGLAGQIRAIKYAADNGAVICQNSWGYTAGTISETDWTRGTYSALTRAMEYFNKYAGLDENGVQTGPMAGGIVIFAAGNDAMNELCYPAADPAAVSVAATGFLGTPSYYTNYGSWVSLSAPGGDQMLSATYGGVYSTSVGADGSSSYEGMQGTSMACPHVSGACALAVSYYYGAEKRKGLTGEMLRQALLSSTQSVDRYCTGSYAAYRGMMGIGSLDTYRLLLTVARMEGIPAQTVAVGATAEIDLAEHFLSTQVLTYTNSDPEVAGVSLQGGILRIEGLRRGTATIVVSDGAAIRKPIEVTVE